MINKLKKSNIRVSLFINPKILDVKKAISLKADCVELHTGNYCNSFERKIKAKLEFHKIKETAYFAQNNGLEVHAGHGLTYKTTKKISRINSISEFNIGHFIVSESLFFGMNKIIKRFKKIINK